ncbi:hypothetical protein PTSG_04034 [Salpingoeca rosetta]|uniref:Uncharacterized protein n=1 Tax=Salpingoeca rosetta (strain ATCC 50818 / BSB-021) TaxID=946362 RepID=F2U7L0_SALR5|nr:uncharacterized protein PTSG_04034 [Salpingoeca rosetta]EGD83427.1 hypothetical protein PTSG_04034 [Salpingoeca rosetta]|eukprot:XP_004994931.1 hypothetical protein PTSG_04034 [Salpingoeca rosetta]
MAEMTSFSVQRALCVNSCIAARDTTSDTIEPDTTLHELGIEGTSLQEADGTPLEEAEVLFYDYSPDVQDLTATALVTQDEYFLKNILVPSQYSKDKTGKGGDASRTAGAGRRRQPSAAS